MERFITPENEMQSKPSRLSRPKDLRPGDFERELADQSRRERKDDEAADLMQQAREVDDKAEPFMNPYSPDYYKKTADKKSDNN